MATRLIKAQAIYKILISDFTITAGHTSIASLVILMPQYPSFQSLQMPVFSNSSFRTARIARKNKGSE